RCIRRRAKRSRTKSRGSCRRARRSCRRPRTSVQRLRWWKSTTSAWQSGGKETPRKCISTGSIQRRTRRTTRRTWF
ncbi:hypothetical protein BGZ59_004821, partial [Podila verticillata]